jgi:hypothetical protein
MVLRVGLWVSAVVATHGVAGLFLPNVYIGCLLLEGDWAPLLLSDSIRVWGASRTVLLSNHKTRCSSTSMIRSISSGARYAHRV